MEKSKYPQWMWLLLALTVAAIVATFVSAVLQVSDDWQIAIVVTMMAPVLIYVGVWYEEDRQHYWDHPRSKILGDVVFVVIGTGLGAGMAVALTIDLIDSRFVRDIVAMVPGFLAGWVLFWWRNPTLYQSEG